MTVLGLRRAISISQSRSVDLIDITTLTEPDATWRYTDAAGHAHQWSESFTLPTLEELYERATKSSR